MSFYGSNSPSSRPKTLMELLLARKIEEASAQGGVGCPSGLNRLMRCDSMDSVSSIGSIGSMILGDDVCRCDDCILGIVDLYIAGPQERAALKKKVFFASPRKTIDNRLIWSDSQRTDREPTRARQPIHNFNLLSCPVLRFRCR